MYVDYRKLEIWKRAYGFTLEIYRTVESFPEYESMNITSQLRRAATCLPLNIAEGSGARSPRIFLNFLIFAYRSSREIETLLMLSRDLKYVSIKRFDELSDMLDAFVRMLSNYMNYVEKEHIRGNRKRDFTNFFLQKKEGMSLRLKEQMG
jgi:four helix bundle protein